ncbi:DNA adenine methylase [Pseudoclavibacter sp. CFCC 13796]|uniref:DNA adenine methylase n=1 Tax=Pseudoclavibacter sp. CFCC 13796 TaxID=2615179 RepID=UPI00298D94FA|nr:DNA adenine methylase [Pseudoclavibacter sp. CFCC 13796]
MDLRCSCSVLPSPLRHVDAAPDTPASARRPPLVLLHGHARRSLSHHHAPEGHVSIPRSPLRCPGGKSALAPLIGNLLHATDVSIVEPFAGSAAVSIALVTAGIIDRAHIADADPGVAAFWHVLTTDHTPLVDWFAATRPTVELFTYWQELDTTDQQLLAQRTLFLSRTAWGAIPMAGPLGGWAQTDGAARITDRWNRQTTLARLGIIVELAHAGRLSAAPGPTSWQETLSTHPDGLAFIDPPYPGDGDRLYRHRFSEHAQLATALRQRPGRSLIVYNDVPLIRGLYAWAPGLRTLDTRYSSITSSGSERSEVLIDTSPPRTTMA